MLRSTLLLLLASLLVVLFLPQLHIALSYVSLFMLSIARNLSHVFANNSIGNLISHTLLLTLLPCLFTAIPAGGYYIVKRQKLPHATRWIVCFWIILLVISALHR